MPGSNFKKIACEIVAGIPKGKVMTYGQIAALSGNPGASRVVGQIAHFGNTSLPWHRVVNARGGMANGYVPGGPDMQAKLLLSEQVVFKGLNVDIEESIWWPKS